MVVSTRPQPGFGTGPRRMRHLLQRLLRERTRLLRFAIVGGIGVLVNSLVLFVLAEGAGLPHTVAATLSTETAILTNFALNDRWTFGDVSPAARLVPRMTRYNALCLGGLIISVGVLNALTHWRQLHYLVANLAGIGVGMVWNYTTSSRLAWAARHGDQGPVPAHEGARR